MMLMNCGRMFIKGNLFTGHRSERSSINNPGTLSLITDPAVCRYHAGIGSYDKTRIRWRAEERSSFKGFLLVYPEELKLFQE